MSKPRHKNVVHYRDEEGRIIGTDVWRTSAGESLAVVPRETRLVDIVDSEGHLIGVLVHGDNAPPLLLVRGDDGPAPMLALVDGGLAGVFDEPWIDNLRRISVLGEGVASYEVDCHECLAGYPVDAEELRAKAETRGQRVARLVVSR